MLKCLKRHKMAMSSKGHLGTAWGSCCELSLLQPLLRRGLCTAHCLWPPAKERGAAQGEGEISGGISASRAGGAGRMSRSRQELSISIPPLLGRGVYTVRCSRWSCWFRLGLVTTCASPSLPSRPFVSSRGTFHRAKRF